MKHKRLAAAVLAAALWLTGCGGAAAPAAPASSGAASQSAADTAVQTAQKDRITEQFTLEKTIQRYEWSGAQKLTVHVPQLVCDSPDAAYLNDELAAMYAADFREYVGTAIDIASREKVSASLADVERREKHRRHAARCEHSRHTAFKRSDFRRHGIVGGILQPAVEIARLLQVEQTSHLIRVLILKSG